MTNQRANRIERCVLALSLLLVIGQVTAETVVQKAPSGMALIPAGVYSPPFRSANATNKIPVQEFYLDILPVTNEEFLEFVRANPRWRRSQVKRAAADDLYLKHWSGDLLIDEKIKNAPVTFVSYYAAKAYAQWKNKRLPTVAEWEYAGAASPTRVDGENDPAFQKQILKWYSSPTSDVLPNVGSGDANIFWVRDLHGLVWEWTEDFYTAFGMPEAACGGAAKDAKDRGDYPAFLRFGFRSSLKMDYTIHNLGFRCAKDLQANSNEKSNSQVMENFAETRD